MSLDKQKRHIHKVRGVKLVNRGAVTAPSVLISRHFS